MKLDYKKILAASPVYEVKNENMNRIQREDIDNLILKLDETRNPNRSASEPKYYGAFYTDVSLYLYIHPALIDQFIMLPGFVIIRAYPDRRMATKNEIGFVGPFRVILDSSLEDFVIDGPDHKMGNRMEDTFISIAHLTRKEKEFNSKDYLVIKSW